MVRKKQKRKGEVKYRRFRTLHFGGWISQNEKASSSSSTLQKSKSSTSEAAMVYYHVLENKVIWREWHVHCGVRLLDIFKYEVESERLCWSGGCVRCQKAVGVVPSLAACAGIRGRHAHMR